MYIYICIRYSLESCPLKFSPRILIYLGRPLRDGGLQNVAGISPSLVKCISAIDLHWVTNKYMWKMSTCGESSVNDEMYISPAWIRWTSFSLRSFCPVQTLRRHQWNWNPSSMCTANALRSDSCGSTDKLSQWISESIHCTCSLVLYLKWHFHLLHDQATNVEIGSNDFIWGVHIRKVPNQNSTDLLNFTLDTTQTDGIISGTSGNGSSIPMESPRTIIPMIETAVPPLEVKKNAANTRKYTGLFCLRQLGCQKPFSPSTNVGFKEETTVRRHLSSASWAFPHVVKMSLRGKAWKAMERG